MGKQILLIINPKAGKGRYRSEISYIIEHLCAGGASVHVHMTKHPGHASELAAREGSNYDIVACLGGDGTLGETIAGLMELRDRPPVGYIPAGTTNDMATTLELPKDSARAARLMLEGKRIPVDIGRFKEKYFVYIAAFGAFTEVSYQTPSEIKQTWGHFGYMLEGISRLTKITPRKLIVEYDEDGRVEGEFIFGAVANTLSIAGLWKLKPDMVDLADGAFEVILVKNPKNILDLSVIFMDIVTNKEDSEYVQIFKAKKIRFLFEEPVPWTRDGEAGGEHTELTLENIKPGVEIFVPHERE